MTEIHCDKAVHLGLASDAKLFARRERKRQITCGAKQSFLPYKHAVLRDSEIPPKQLYVKGVTFSERIIFGSFVKMSIVYPVILNGLFLNLVSVYTSYFYIYVQYIPGIHFLVATYYL